MKNTDKIHPLADVHSKEIGENTTVWQFAVILEGAKIGQNCNINCHTFIENNVNIGDNVTVKSGIYLWNGITIEDNVFLGPNVVFTNDIRPRSKQYKKALQTLIQKGASIGANSTILPGITIGTYALVGTQSNVTKDIPSHALVYGNPAKIMGWVDENGEKLNQLGNGNWVSKAGTIYEKSNNGLNKKI